MHYIVVYDITDDGLRQKVSNRLKDYGLERIQYSTFQGEMVRHVVASLATEIRRMINDGEETDSVLILPMCSSCIKGRIEIGAQKEFKQDETRVSLF